MFDFFRDWFRRFWCWLIRILFAPNEISRSMSECVYGWTSAYRIAESACTLNVVVRIRLNPDAAVTAAQLQAAQATWEPAIEQTWSGAFPITRQAGSCACPQYPVVVDVQWVTTGQHHAVRVQAGNGRADMLNWFAGMTGAAAAHEVGHMLGNVDEYADAACPDRNVTNDNSIMQTLAGVVRQRHYGWFSRWLSDRTCCRYAVV